MIDNEDYLKALEVAKLYRYRKDGYINLHESELENFIKQLPKDSYEVWGDDVGNISVQHIKL